MVNSYFERMSSLRLIPDEKTEYLVLYETPRYSQLSSEYEKFYRFLDQMVSHEIETMSKKIEALISGQIRVRLSTRLSTEIIIGS